MLDAPFYLAVGSCVLEDGSGQGPYHVQGMSFPEPAPDGQGGFPPAVRTISPLKITGSTPAELTANIATLRREAVRDRMLRFRPCGSGDVSECRIREATMVEADYDPLRRSLTADPHAYLTLTIETEPHWLGPWSDDTVVELDTVPGHFDVDDIGGEDDALVRMRAVFDDSGTAAAIGVRPDPMDGYEYLDDYGASGDTADANALGGYKVGEVVDATLAGNAIGIAPSIDTNANRGQHLVVARLDSTAVSAATVTAQASVVTTGNLIGESVTVAAHAVTCASTSLVGIELGNVQIPAGAVPDLTVESGLGAVGPRSAQTTRDATRTITSAESVIEIKQTLAPFNGPLTAIEYRVDVAPSATQNASLGFPQLVVASGSGGESAMFAVPSSVGTHRVELDSPLDLRASDSPYFTLTFARVDGGSLTVGMAVGEDRLPGYAMTTPTGSGESSGDDLVFTAYGRERLGFETLTPVAAACSETSKTVALDYVQRVPVDYAALVYRKASAGALALFYDGDTDTPYVADADGIGPAVYDKCEVRKPLRFRPGVVNRVVLANLQADAAIGGATITYAHRPRYLTAVS